jgi:16S rRNA (cytosine967-C5)-methyltransferase
VLALDVDAARLTRVQDNLDRVGIAATLLAGDAARPDTWWDGRPFDAILLDAPCTASGIVRRHPDVRWLRRPNDVAALAATQARLLDALWPLLVPGGHLLYATCSVFRAEGSHQIDAFLQRTAGAEPRPSPGHLLPLPENGRTTVPGRPAVTGDGFFYALLQKRGG